jgi:hypothetical protein
MKHDLYFLICVAISLASGCSDRPVALANVSGTITRDGQPLAQVTVAFQPIAIGKKINPGPGSVGVTDANGHYELKTFDHNLPGAMIGKHRVIIDPDLHNASTDDRQVSPSQKTNERFRNGSLTIEVTPAGLPHADFDLAP